jgi:hypothetical protein
VLSDPTDAPALALEALDRLDARNGVVGEIADARGVPIVRPGRKDTRRGTRPLVM